MNPKLNDADVFLAVKSAVECVLAVAPHEPTSPTSKTKDVQPDKTKEETDIVVRSL